MSVCKNDILAANEVITVFCPIDVIVSSFFVVISPKCSLLIYHDTIIVCFIGTVVDRNPIAQIFCGISALCKRNGDSIDIFYFERALGNVDFRPCMILSVVGNAHNPVGAIYCAEGYFKNRL